MKVYITGGYHGLIQEVEETRTFEQCSWIIRRGGKVNPKAQINVWEDEEDAINFLKRKARIRIMKAYDVFSDASIYKENILQL